MSVERSRAAFTQAALGLVGTPFRLHGRDPATGLDCVGLIAEAMRHSGLRVEPPSGYRLRLQSIDPWLSFAEASGLIPATSGGDVLLLRVHPLQPHLAAAVPGGLVHAHAGLGRVTFLPGGPPWRIERGWHLPPLER